MASRAVAVNSPLTKLGSADAHSLSSTPEQRQAGQFRELGREPILENSIGGIIGRRLRSAVMRTSAGYHRGGTIAHGRPRFV
jgi:hypothetical protein